MLLPGLKVCSRLNKSTTTFIWQERYSGTLVSTYFTKVKCIMLCISCSYKCIFRRYFFKLWSYFEGFKTILLKIRIIYLYHKSHYVLRIMVECIFHIIWWIINECYLFKLKVILKKIHNTKGRWKVAKLGGHRNIR